jgi:hypothetical protein
MDAEWWIAAACLLYGVVIIHTHHGVVANIEELSLIINKAQSKLIIYFHEDQFDPVLVYYN